MTSIRLAIAGKNFHRVLRSKIRANAFYFIRGRVNTQVRHVIPPRTRTLAATATAP